MTITQYIKPPRTNDPIEVERFYRAISDKINYILNIEWTEVTSFSNSWVNYGSIYYNAGYCKDSFGFVHLRGLIKSGTVADDSTGNAFTLPTGNRPSMTVINTVIGNNKIGRVDIYNDGSVRIMIPTENNFVSLDGITFYAG